jgi:hypothetical protein
MSLASIPAFERSQISVDSIKGTKKLIETREELCNGTILSATMRRERIKIVSNGLALPRSHIGLNFLLFGSFVRVDEIVKEVELCKGLQAGWLARLELERILRIINWARANEPSDVEENQGAHIASIAYFDRLLWWQIFYYTTGEYFCKRKKFYLALYGCSERFLV